MDWNKLWIEKLLYPAMEWKNGNRIRAYTRELIASEQAGREQLFARQREKLRAFLRNCVENVPAYATISGGYCRKK